MFAAIGYNLKRLFDVKGRDGRRTFLLYALAVVLLNILVMLAVIFPAMAAVFTEVSSAAKSGPEAIEAAALDAMIQRGVPGTMVRTSLALGLLNIILLSAAFVRRSHDSGLPGLILVVPLAIHLVWMFFAFRQVDGLSSSMRAAADIKQAGGGAGLQTAMIAQDAIGWVAVLTVLAIGMIKSQPSPNQYGDVPAPL
ncbi:DUF805 domain-containing protein [Pontixanthobacter aquaemixtae]|uniref:DUF805 domain-containing protein n=1 Tax=Pontixanthobacter aquaemixtae TaxID=1958940 RepID=A0A844ZSG3_9SPHN|nr:DUF805 domain-containing protein [Pontixanthobacter aquaemixtae]MXO90252.1 DUF805 domain-containing protein [Pontixanthobacter aquaemixtae]